MKGTEAHQVFPGGFERDSATPDQSWQVHGGFEAGDFGGWDQKNSPTLNSETITINRKSCQPFPVELSK